MTKKVVSMTLDSELLDRLDNYCRAAERQRSWFISKAIEAYLDDIEDLETAHRRLNDPDEKRISEKELRERLGI